MFVYLRFYCFQLTFKVFTRNLVQYCKMARLAIGRNTIFRPGTFDVIFLANLPLNFGSSVKIFIINSNAGTYEMWQNWKKNLITERCLNKSYFSKKKAHYKCKPETMADAMLNWDNVDFSPDCWCPMLNRSKVFGPLPVVPNKRPNQPEIDWHTVNMEARAAIAWSQFAIFRLIEAIASIELPYGIK